MTTYPPQELWLLYQTGNKWKGSDDINYVAQYLTPALLPIADKVMHRLHYLQSDVNVHYYAEDDGKWRYRISFKDTEHNFSEVASVHRTAIVNK